MKGLIEKLALRMDANFRRTGNAFHTFSHSKKLTFLPVSISLSLSLYFLSILNMSFLSRPAFDREPRPVLLPEETFNVSLSLSLCVSYPLTLSLLLSLILLSGVIYEWCSRVAACLQHLLVLETQSQRSCHRERERPRERKGLEYVGAGKERKCV